MKNYTDKIRLQLLNGPQGASYLIDLLGISQPTLSRVLRSMDSEIIRFGAARSIQYALKDRQRSHLDMPIYRVNPQGQIEALGQLTAVHPQGFVMQQTDGRRHYSQGLPWWLLDMRPQGYQARAWAARHASGLQLPSRLEDWSDSQALEARLLHGHDHDCVGHLLLGDKARQRFVSQPEWEAIETAHKAKHYVALAAEASQGAQGSALVGGDQPKFTAYAQTASGPRHVIVKFSEAHAGAVAERWRDLLLAEHLALRTLAQHGVAAALSRCLDANGQRFLEVQRFDRVGDLGRRGLVSLAALAAEFVGAAQSGWPAITRQLARGKYIAPEAADQAALLWVFGSLIGNTDMHGGNLSFLTDKGRPYQLAAAYDMTPMALAPRTGGSLPESIPSLHLRADVAPAHWRQGASLAQHWLARVQESPHFSPRFSACIQALQTHLADANVQIARLA